MKRTIVNILLGLVFLVGLGILIYPTVSNQWNTYQQSKLINAYEEMLSTIEVEDFREEWELARQFNDSMAENSVYEDVFGLEDVSLENTEYWKVLNIADDGIMGYLSIPKINVKLTICHGTEEKILETSIGHLNGTKLPIGGESTHSVLVAHRGLPSARLFTDIDQLEVGDMFYVHVLDETLAYEVDQILDMIDPLDERTMKAALGIEDGEDQVTLFTCTPYGVNSHRLLVRGTRVPYSAQQEAEEAGSAIPEAVLGAIQDYSMVYLLLGAAVAGLLIVVIRFLRKRRDIEETIKEQDQDGKAGNG